MGNTKEVYLGFAQEIASKIGLPLEIKVKISKLCDQVDENRWINWRSNIAACAVATVLAACRESNRPITSNRVRTVAKQIYLRNEPETKKLERKETNRAVSQLLRRIGIRILPLPAADYLKQFCRDLELSKKTKLKAEKIMGLIQKRKKEDICRSSSLKAVSAIYAAGILVNKYIPKKRIAEITGVSIPAITKTVKKMFAKLDLEKGKTEKPKKPI